METTPGNSAAIAYGSFLGGCKGIQNYYLPLSRGAAPAKAPKPKAYGCKQCTALSTKVRMGLPTTKDHHCARNKWAPAPGFLTYVCA